MEALTSRLEMIYFTYSACCKMMIRDFWISRQFMVNLFVLFYTDSTAYDILQCRDSRAVTQTSHSHVWGLRLVHTRHGQRHVQRQCSYMFPVRDLNMYLNNVFGRQKLETLGFFLHFFFQIKHKYNSVQKEKQRMLNTKGICTVLTLRRLYINELWPWFCESIESKYSVSSLIY